MQGCRLGLFAAVAALALGLAGEAAAHIVPVGVGTQTWIDVRPRKLTVRFNLGFSSILAITEMKLADKNSDRVIDADEEKAYLAALGERILPKLRFHLDGKPVTFRVLGREAAGMRGPIESVGFDTFFDLEAALEAVPGPHELRYYEGTYEGQEAQQILYLVTSRVSDFAQFEHEQETPGPMLEQPEATQFSGRDVTLKFEFRGKTLERDRAEKLLEPALAGLQGAVDALATQVARSAEKDLGGFSWGEVTLTGSRGFGAVSRPSGFNISKPIAAEREGTPSPGPNLVAATNTNLSGFEKVRLKAAELIEPETDNEGDELKKMMAKTSREPFAWAALLTFFIWGAIHAKGPGHGKTMVAAYLLGTQGRMWDAIRLGLIVTFTHTFTLYTFGLGLVYVVERWKQGSSQMVMQRSIFLLTLASGIGLTFYGLGLARRRWKAFQAAEVAAQKAIEQRPSTSTSTEPAPVLAPPSSGKRLSLVAAAPVEAAPAAHTHSHGDHMHSHGDGHTHSHGDGHTHSHGDGHTHSHGGHSHDHENMDDAEHAALHAREAATTKFRDLLSLGLSSGIVPCPAGITLIAFSLSFAEQNTMKCFVYLNAFSFGLGAVLVGIAVAMVISRRYLERAMTEKRRRILKVLPVYSALLISIIGLSICYEAKDPNFASVRRRVADAISPLPGAKLSTKSAQ